MTPKLAIAMLFLASLAVAGVADARCHREEPSRAHEVAACVGPFPPPAPPLTVDEHISLPTPVHNLLQTVYGVSVCPGGAAAPWVPLGSCKNAAEEFVCTLEPGPTEPMVCVDLD